MSNEQTVPFKLKLRGTCPFCAGIRKVNRSPDDGGMVIPWKKPSETPVSGHDCILKVPGIGGNMLTYLARTWIDATTSFYSDDGERIPMEAVHCWVYAHELPFPTPEWIKK